MLITPTGNSLVDEIRSEFERMSRKLFSRSKQAEESSSYAPREDNYLAPTKHWAEKLHLPEICHAYDLAFRDDHANVQKRILSIKDEFGLNSEALSDEVNRIYRSLYDAYPEIATIRLLKDDDRYHVVLGCVSQFSPEDIRHFLKVFGVRRNSYMENYRKFRIEATVGFKSFQWRMSPVTFALVEERLGLKPFGFDCDPSGPINALLERNIVNRLIELYGRDCIKQRGV